jgi:hypothetical protein
MGAAFDRPAGAERPGAAAGGVAAAPTDAPQWLQKRAPGSVFLPHWLQKRSARLDPQCEQKFPADVSPQRGQVAFVIGPFRDPFGSVVRSRRRSGASGHRSAGR